MAAKVNGRLWLALCQSCAAEYMRCRAGVLRKDAMSIIYVCSSGDQTSRREGCEEKAADVSSYQMASLASAAAAALPAALTHARAMAPAQRNAEGWAPTPTAEQAGEKALTSPLAPWIVYQSHYNNAPLYPFPPVPKEDK